MQLDIEIEKNKAELIKSMQASFEKVAKDIDENLSKTGSRIKENIAEIPDFGRKFAAFRVCRW